MECVRLYTAVRVLLLMLDTSVCWELWVVAWHPECYLSLLDTIVVRR